MDPSRRSQARNVLLSVSGRILVSYLIFKAFNGTKLANSASVDDSGDFCSATSLQESINKVIAAQGDSTQSTVSKAAIDLFKKCNKEFLKENSISQEVKQTVDTWLGMKLDQLDAHDLGSAYQQALMNQKPEKTSDLFSKDCKEMIESYESFRDNTVVLAKHIDISSGALLTDDGQVSAEELALFNYAQYGRFCSLLLGFDGPN